MLPLLNQLHQQVPDHFEVLILIHNLLLLRLKYQYLIIY